MGDVTGITTFSALTTAVAAEVNGNFTAITNQLNNNIENSNISNTAGIVASKLNLTSPGAIGSTAPSSGKFTTLEGTTSLKLATGATVTGIDNGDVGTGSATLLATQNAVKTYVDAQATSSGKILQQVYNSVTTELGPFTTAVFSRSSRTSYVVTTDFVMRSAFDTAITPKSATSNLFVEVCLQFSSGTAGVINLIALTKDAGTTAIAASVEQNALGDWDCFPQILTYSEASGSTTTRTFKIGTGMSGNNQYINVPAQVFSTSAAQGVWFSYVKITEIEA